MLLQLGVQQVEPALAEYSNKNVAFGQFLEEYLAVVHSWKQNLSIHPYIGSAKASSESIADL